ncbi:MAG: hypothetical protein CMJ81_07240 [Planctomycetaceae bacterium]|nr:hypothetical protein [Planctomycetaceae bacterium]
MRVPWGLRGNCNPAQGLGMMKLGKPSRLISKWAGRAGTLGLLFPVSLLIPKKRNRLRQVMVSNFFLCSIW